MISYSICKKPRALESDRPGLWLDHPPAVWPGESGLTSLNLFANLKNEINCAYYFHSPGLLEDWNEIIGEITLQIARGCDGNARVSGESWDLRGWVPEESGSDVLPSLKATEVFQVSQRCHQPRTAKSPSLKRLRMHVVALVQKVLQMDPF